MGYIFLSVAIIGEFCATNFLKLSDGFHNLNFTIASMFGYLVTFYFLSLSLKTIEMDVAYAIWAAVGIVLIALFSVVYWKEPLNLPSIFGIALIAIGVVILQLFGTGEH